jgi:hypothetical protein
VNNNQDCFLYLYKKGKREKKRKLLIRLLQEKIRSPSSMQQRARQQRL